MGPERSAGVCKAQMEEDWLHSGHFSFVPHHIWLLNVCLSAGILSLHEKLNYIKLKSDTDVLQPIMLDWELRSNLTCALSEVSTLESSWCSPHIVEL